MQIIKFLKFFFWDFVIQWKINIEKKQGIIYVGSWFNRPKEPNIATDINKNALELAKKNIEKYDLTDKIVTKLTNGLTSIDIENSDNIVISGMGTHTILEILKSQGLNKA